MSTAVGLSTNWWRSLSLNQAGAGVAAIVLTGAYLSVLYEVVNVVNGSGGVTVFAIEVAAAVAMAAALSRTLSVRQAVALGVVLLVVGLVGYVITVPGAYFDIARQTEDTIALLTGLSVLRMTKAGIWAIGFTPAPVFVSWYCFFRRRYTLGVIVGGAALGFFLLTGDADTVLGLVGVLGALAVMGFGRLDLEAGTGPQRQTVIALLIAILVVTTSISLVPGGDARPLLPDRGSATVEGSLVDAGETVEILGSIRLSPEVRFTVTATEGAMWRVGAYDRYTGDGWVRTGRAAPYSGQLSFPDGDEIDRVRQTFRAESSVNVMPAAWKPVEVGRGADQTMVTTMEGLQPSVPLDQGDVYTVESFRDEPSTLELRGAGTDYPEAIRERYSQLPESTPERVTTFTTQLTANADNPYDTAAVIEQWLQRNKGYSLDVDRPRGGDTAARFLFDMEQGYCVYFATTMVAMLRSQDIPARFVVGYTTGQRVAENRWVVRGLNSHAWVEVYFPHKGWVAFDPTPSGPRLELERDRVSQARNNDEENVDTSLSSQGTYTTPDPTGGTTSTPGGTVNASDDDAGFNTTGTPPLGLFGAEGGPTGQTEGSDGTGGLPSRETMIYGAILLAGVGMAVHRTGAANRGYRALWLRRRPTGPPDAQIHGMFTRLEYLLGRWYRPRRPDETPREYVESLRSRGIDERAVTLYGLYEHARYAGSAADADADRAWELLVDLRETRSFWR